MIDNEDLIQAISHLWMAICILLINIGILYYWIGCKL